MASRQRTEVAEGLVSAVGLMGEMADRMEAMRTERDRYKAALEDIQRYAFGQVCETFEVCQHKACNASYSAWAIASQALKGAA